MARTISVTAKCSDCCFVDYRVHGSTEGESEGYVPHEIGIGGGDYIELTIDIDTGQVVNWKVPEESALNYLRKGIENVTDCHGIY